VEGFPFLLLGIVKDINSYIYIYIYIYIVEWRYSVQHGKKWEERTVPCEETQQKLGRKRNSSVVSDAAATREPAQRRRRTLLWRPRPETLNWQDQMVQELRQDGVSLSESVPRRWYQRVIRLMNSDIKCMK